MRFRRTSSILASTLAALALTLPGSGRADTDSPIRHVVIIFQENVSFDHYFGTYPSALNPQGEPAFHARRGTPTVNGYTPALLNHNPNQVNPFRFDRSQAATCDQDHDYTDEQIAFDKGAMDLFVETLGDGPGTDGNLVCKATDVMGYYDGNTVTALWNYAQHFAMSDNSYSDTFGPSTPGAINVTSGNPFGAICGPSSAVFHAPVCTAAPGATAATPGVSAPQGPGTTYSDADPNFDICTSTQDGRAAAQTIQMGGKNVGDLLNAANVSWG